MVIIIIKILDQVPLRIARCVQSRPQVILRYHSLCSRLFDWLKPSGGPTDVIGYGFSFRKKVITSSTWMMGVRRGARRASTGFWRRGIRRLAVFRVTNDSPKPLRKPVSGAFHICMHIWLKPWVTVTWWMTFWTGIGWYGSNASAKTMHWRTHQMRHYCSLRSRILGKKISCDGARFYLGYGDGAFRWVCPQFALCDDSWEECTLDAQVTALAGTWASLVTTNGIPDGPACARPVYVTETHRRSEKIILVGLTGNFRL